MAINNRQRVERALDLLRDGLKPYVERTLKVSYKDRWLEVAAGSFGVESSLRRSVDEMLADPANLLRVVWDQWNNVYKGTLGHAERSYISELRDVRNRWAHSEPFSSDDAYRALDSMQRLLASISAAEQV